MADAEAAISRLITVASFTLPFGGGFGRISIIGDSMRNLIETMSRRKILASVHIPKRSRHIMIKRKDDILLRNKPNPQSSMSRRNEK